MSEEPDELTTEEGAADPALPAGVRFVCAACAYGLLQSMKEGAASTETLALINEDGYPTLHVMVAELPMPPRHSRCGIALEVGKLGWFSTAHPSADARAGEGGAREGVPREGGSREGVWICHFCRGQGGYLGRDGWEDCPCCEGVGRHFHKPDDPDAHCPTCTCHLVRVTGVAGHRTPAEEEEL